MAKQTLNSSDFKKIYRLQLAFDLDTRIATILYMGLMYECDYGYFDPYMFKDEFHLGESLITSKELIETMEQLHLDAYTRKASVSKDARETTYCFDYDLMNYFRSGNEEYLEMFSEKKDLINLSFHWFSQSFREGSRKINAVVLDETNKMDSDPILKYIKKKNNNIHLRVAIVFLIGAYASGKTSLSLANIIERSIAIPSIRNRYSGMWSDPECDIYSCGLVQPTVIVNEKVNRIGLDSKFIKKFSIINGGKDAHDLQSDLFDIIYPDQIVQKRLIYPADIQRKIDLYFDQISHNNYDRYLDHMKRQNLPQSYKVMLFGGAGVGKTELVRQIALKYNRPILTVHLSELRTMWYGESERLVHQLFVDIKRVTSELEVDPIVLFNEADGFFHSRSGENHKHETNTNIITILLNELENFNGILIATTNFTSSIDKAFERRFTLKIHIPSPDESAVKAIIKHKLNISDEVFVDRLVRMYRITPAELDNVKQKSILLNIHPDQQSEMEELIREEHTGWDMDNNRKQIGFN
jgi:hypothetical protein